MHLKLFLPTFLFLLGTLNIEAQTYYNFPHIGWKQTQLHGQGDYMGNYDEEIYETQINRDTIINGNVFFVLEDKFSERYYRNESGKIISIDTFSNQETVIMDFSLEEKDTFIIKKLIIFQGIISDTLFVYKKEKIAGPANDSLIKIRLTKDLNYPYGGDIWIEGVGSAASGFVKIPHIDEMTYGYTLCTRNDLDQTIYSSEFFDFNCEFIYGQDMDNDGSRVIDSTTIVLDRTYDNYNLNKEILAHSCDTICVKEETGYSILFIADNLEIEPDSIIGTLGVPGSIYYFYNLSNYNKILVTHQIGEIGYTIYIVNCPKNDCDDTDPNINPDAVEIPNNDIDENCDGIILIIDDDMDGYNGDVDCDDDNASINPGADEICDELDNNCDGQVDEGLEFTTYYTDLDTDGYGDDESYEDFCIEPPGSSTQGGDCDDTNSKIYPGAEEIPNNGIDEDCDGEDLTTETSEVDQFQFQITPNPSTGIFNVIGNQTMEKILLYSTDGKVLKEVKFEPPMTETKLILNELPSGSYMLEIIGSQYLSRRVIVKQ